MGGIEGPNFRDRVQPVEPAYPVADKPRQEPKQSETSKEGESNSEQPEDTTDKVEISKEALEKLRQSQKEQTKEPEGGPL